MPYSHDDNLKGYALARALFTEVNPRKLDELEDEIFVLGQHAIPALLTLIGLLKRRACPVTKAAVLQEFDEDP